MCQVLWHLDVFYPLKIVINSVKVAPKKSGLSNSGLWNTHPQVISDFATIFLETSDYVGFT